MLLRPRVPADLVPSHTHTHHLLPFLCIQGANRPSARAITLALLNKPYFKAVMNNSVLASALGQLVCE